MKLLDFFLEKPLRLLVLAPVAFILGAGVMLASGNGDSTDTALSGTPWATTALAATSTAVPEVEPTAEPANRADCDSIEGTEYLSIVERDWYRENCTLTALTSNTANTTSGGGGTGGGGGGHVTGYEYYTGASLVIPSAGVSAAVNGVAVGPSGVMPDPSTYFDVVLYNFDSFAGLGGKNKVIAGHVDCAHCHNGGSGTAVFWSIRSLGYGQQAFFYNPDGTVSTYVVVASYEVSPNTNWASIVASDAADMTLITCTGTFSGGEYNTRHVVQLALQ